MFKKVKCAKCENKVKDSYDFCPFCGQDMRNPQKDMKDYGMLGKSNVEGYPLLGGGGMGITDRMLDSMMKSLVKALDKQMKSMGENNMSNVPGGIKIQLGMPQTPQKEAVKKKVITKEQIERMTGLPRVPAKTNVRRLSDKVVYELKAPGIESIEDVFVSKVESGYELKAIGKKKVYVTSLPVNLPLKSYSLHQEGLTVEFALQ